MSVKNKDVLQYVLCNLVFGGMSFFLSVSIWYCLGINIFDMEGSRRKMNERAIQERMYRPSEGRRILLDKKVYIITGCYTYRGIDFCTLNNGATIDADFASRLLIVDY